MRFSANIVALAAAAATLVGATNTVTFKNQDDTTREVLFTPSAGNDDLAQITVEGGSSKTVTFPHSWVGNWFARPQGESYAHGMLGEVTFNGWDGINYFDVSSIVNASDIHNVKELYPVSEESNSPKSLISGCALFPCNHVYITATDTQTVSSEESDFICTLGTSSSSDKRDFNERQLDERHLVAHHYVLGQLS